MPVDLKYNPYVSNSGSRKHSNEYTNRDVPLVILPEGTLLFRAVNISPDGMNFFTDTLGVSIKNNIELMDSKITGTTGVCLSSSQNVFTFPFPYVGFGLYDWEKHEEAWKKYNAFVVYFIAKSAPFVNMISPSKDVRGTPKGNKIGDSIVRCNILGNKCFKPIKNPEKGYLSYDNCIDPKFSNLTNTIGSISIAEQDSFGRIGKVDINKPLAKYARLLKNEGKGDILLSITKNLYKDGNNVIGIPEIVTHVRNPEASKTVLVRNDILTFKDGINELFKDINAGVLNIIPLAVITGTGISNVTDPDFNILVGDQDNLTRKNNIEENLKNFMINGRNIGFGSGLGKIIDDKRTGFYILEERAPPEYLDAIKSKNRFIFNKYTGVVIPNISGGKISKKTKKRSNRYTLKNVRRKTRHHK